MRRLTALLLTALAALVFFAGTAQAQGAPVAAGGSTNGNDWE